MRLHAHDGRGAGNSWKRPQQQPPAVMVGRTFALRQSVCDHLLLYRAVSGMHGNPSRRTTRMSEAGSRKRHRKGPLNEAVHCHDEPVIQFTRHKTLVWSLPVNMSTAFRGDTRRGDVSHVWQ